MAININLKIKKKDLFLLSAIVIFLIAAGCVIAWNPGGNADPSIMGHSANEIEGVQAKITNGMTACAGANLAIKTINSTTGAVTCETDDVGGGGGGSLSCHTHSADSTSTTASISCEDGEFLTGGGCHSGQGSTAILDSNPIDFHNGAYHGWHCIRGGNYVTVYAMCCTHT